MTRHTKGLLIRVILFLGALGTAIILEPVFGWLLNQSFHYQPTPFYFGSIEALTIALIFFMGILFEIEGRKLEFGWIILFFIAAFVLLLEVPNPNFEKYLALIGAAIAGNAIGFILKFLRGKLFLGGHSLGKL